MQPWNFPNCYGQIVHISSMIIDHYSKIRKYPHDSQMVKFGAEQNIYSLLLYQDLLPTTVSTPISE